MAINREELLRLTKEEAIDFLLSVIKDMAEVIKAQNERIAELEARLNQNCKNSSRPPSSDGFKKPKSLRKPSGKKPGGQHGHEGRGLKLMHISFMNQKSALFVRAQSNAARTLRFGKAGMK